MSVTSGECGEPFGLEHDLELIELLEKREYSLNAVNHYGDNLLHVGAANGCVESVKMILSRNKSSCVDRKNKFGWTPLMHAIRADEPQTVRTLLEHGADATLRNYLGVSTLSLAAGVSREMFEMIVDACPSVLKNSAYDDVTPLCVAAMKNDKELFLELTRSGSEAKKESTYAHLAMRHSTIPEIRSLANLPPEIQEYWNDRSDDIPRRRNGGRCDLSTAVDDRGAKRAPPSIRVSSAEETARKRKAISSNAENTSRELKLPTLGLLSLKESRLEDGRSMSPNLIYNRDAWFAGSPNLRGSRGLPNCIRPPRLDGPSNNPDNLLVPKKQRNKRDVRVCDEPIKENSLAITSHRIWDIHAFDSRIEDHSADHNASLSFAPEFSPPRSPCLPSDFKDEDVCGADTPTPPHYKTPPQGMVLNSDQAKLIITLRQFDLEHHIPRFLAEEVDMSLFLTLNDRDLTEIGIPEERDRKALLAVIDAHAKNEHN